MPRVRARRSVRLSFVLMLVTVGAGLAVRFAALGLPTVMVKYGGSALWALMLYWIVSGVLASWQLWRVALLTGVVATAVELFKLYESPGVDAFRHTLAGVLLLGRVFSLWDIGVYWTAIIVGALIDYWLRRSAADC